MSYNTQWRIVKDNKPIFVYNGGACFGSFTSGYSTSIANTFDSDRKMEIFLSKKYTKCTDEEIRFWIDGLKRIGLKVTISEQDFSDGKFNERDYPNIFKSEPHYIFTVDFKDYSSKAQVNFVCHLLRYTWEYNQFEIVRRCFEYYKTDNKNNFFNIFLFIILTGPMYQGHSCGFGKGYLYKMFTLKEIKDIYIEWSKAKYTNNELSFLAGNIKAKNATGGTITTFKGPNPANSADISQVKTIKEYKEILKKYAVGKVKK